MDILEFVNENALVINSIYVLLLAVWFLTGRLSFIGWIFKISWWLTISPLLFVLWVAVVIINTVLNAIRNSQFFVFIMLGLMIWAAVIYQENQNKGLITAAFAILIFLLIKFGLQQERVWDWIFITPKPLKQPQPKPKESELEKAYKQHQKKQDLKTPIVKIAVRKIKKFENIHEVIAQLQQPSETLEPTLQEEAQPSTEQQTASQEGTT